MVVGGMMMANWAAVSGQQGWRKGPWTPEEDKLLTEYVNLHGEGRWSSVARSAGLNRSGKSCRLRWVNYLRPGLIRGHLTPQEQGIIIELHALWGNKWSTIARYLPGRTDNEIKNFWRTHFKKKGKRPAEKRGKKKLMMMMMMNSYKQQQNHDHDFNYGVEEMNGAESSAKVISPEPQSEVICEQNSSDHHQQQQQPLPSIYPPNMENIINPTIPGTFPIGVESPPWTAEYTFPIDGLWGWPWNFEDQMNNIVPS